MNHPFQPRPGTVGARALTALAEHGGSLTATELAAALAIPLKNLHACLKAIRSHGLAVTDRNADGVAIWRLPADGELAAPAEATTRPRKQRTTQAQAAPAAEGWEPLTPRIQRVNGRTAATGDLVTDEPEQPTAIASLWDDGDVVLQGIAINEDAGSVTLSDSQARRVHRFLERVYGPTV